MPSGQNHSLISRRSFLTHGSMALTAMAGSSLLGSSRYAKGQSNGGESIEVKTAYGRLRGKRTNNVITFKGVPYAGPVS